MGRAVARWIDFTDNLDLLFLDVNILLQSTCGVEA